eukprot:CAMPEP_0114123220 /NCGR_PEP_ID=MMETSP0043_2-20121206/8107_1 /TAXON_ID=464988 /ORGANISM="Hemiselmis andersenii, Strain CCMP644" /LENGTH=128 /DNA_ID=CAMNT_0001215977 /DNA_START=168 /DNA_END=551 /DNA_ORIENTATION=-
MPVDAVHGAFVQGLQREVAEEGGRDDDVWVGDQDEIPEDSLTPTFLAQYSKSGMRRLLGILSCTWLGTVTALSGMHASSLGQDTASSSGGEVGGGFHSTSTTSALSLCWQESSRVTFRKVWSLLLNPS